MSQTHQGELFVFSMLYFFFLITGILKKKKVVFFCFFFKCHDIFSGSDAASPTGSIRSVKTVASRPTSLRSRAKAGEEKDFIFLFFLKCVFFFFLRMGKKIKLHFVALASPPLTVTVTVVDTQCRYNTLRVEISVAVVLFPTHWKEFNKIK